MLTSSLRRQSKQVVSSSERFGKKFNYYNIVLLWHSLRLMLVTSLQDFQDLPVLGVNSFKDWKECWGLYQTYPLSDHCIELPHTGCSLGIAHTVALLQQHKPTSFSFTWRRGGEIQTGVGPRGRRGKQKREEIGLRDTCSREWEGNHSTVFRMRGNREESKFKLKKYIKNMS